MSLHPRTPPPSRWASSPSLSTDQWHLIEGSASPLNVAPEWPCLWIVAHGTLVMHARDSEWTLGAGEAQLWRGGAVVARPAQDARWFCLTGALAAWQRELTLARDEEPLPWRADCHALAQALDAMSGHRAALHETLFEHQHDVAAYLPRCRGRTPRHRRQTLLRLLHLHHLMRCHLDADDEAMVDVAWLAERAHYSSGHLIRLHRDVFGETPGEYVSRLRDQRAWQLVRETDLPVVAITHKLGFESQSAFCRAFKHAFGMTATQARRGEECVCAA